MAKHYFEDFLSVYQSREAFNNLGLVYYQMAAQEHVKWKPDEPLFRLSLLIDPVTRAKNTFTFRRERPAILRRGLRKSESHESSFLRYAKLAERYFHEAAQRDHTYAMAHNNLACVYFLKSEFSSAVGELDKALLLDPKAPEALNNRAVALLKMGNYLKVDLSNRAEADFKKALRLNPNYADALFNLTYFYKLEGRQSEKEIYLKRFAETRPDKELLDQLR